MGDFAMDCAIIKGDGRSTYIPTDIFTTPISRYVPDIASVLHTYFTLTANLAWDFLCSYERPDIEQQYQNNGLHGTWKQSFWSGKWTNLAIHLPFGNSTHVIRVACCLFTGLARAEQVTFQIQAHSLCPWPRRAQATGRLLPFRANHHLPYSNGLFSPHVTTIC